MFHTAENIEINARCLSRKAARELGEAESWERGAFSLAGGKGLGHVGAISLLGEHSERGGEGMLIFGTWRE